MTEENQDCRQCLVAIAKVETGMTNINGNMMKIFYALIGIIGANIGTKYIGTPWYVYTALYASMFAAIFVFCITVAKWRCLNVYSKWIRISFVISVVYSSFLRIYHYQVATPLTQIEGVVSNMINLSLAVAFISMAWKRDSKRSNKKRRHNDI